jgi:hypothetical protein
MAKQIFGRRVVSVVLAAVLVLGCVPVSMVGSSAAFTTTPMIAAGQSHSLALKSDGTVWAWGYNGEGSVLGDGTTTDRKTPVQVKNLSGVTAIAAGTDHSLALKNDGTVWAWGHAPLGNGSPVASPWLSTASPSVGLTVRTR